MKESKIIAETTKILSLEDICRSDDVVKNLLDIIESHPDETVGNFGRSIIYFIEDDYEKTVSYLESLIQQFPDIVLLRNRLAQTFISKNDFEKPIVHLEKVLELDNNNLTSKIWLTLSYFKVGNTPKENKYLNDLRRFVYILKAAQKK